MINADHIKAKLIEVYGEGMNDVMDYGWVPIIVDAVNDCVKFEIEDAIAKLKLTTKG